MKKVLFCHGMPGSQIDADLLRAANPNVEIIAIDLLSFPPESVDLAFANALGAKSIAADQDGIPLVGFSIGAMAAIKIAAAHPQSVSRLTLISPAGPLSLGDFLPEMAGKPVFEMAIRRPMMLRALTAFQGLLTRCSPNTMINLLFGKCGPAEKSLLKGPVFRNGMVTALTESFANRPSNYLAYINAYVSDWSDTLDMVQCPVDLWHGTNDTWSPPQMSAALAEAFGDKATVKLVQDAEHYSAMAQVTL